MKLPLLLAALLGSSTAALAQKMILPPASQKKQERIPVILNFPSGWVVAQPSYLYRSLHDARLGHYAHRVRTGDLVEAKKATANAHWLRVTRPDASDTTIYYMPASAISYKGSAPRLWTIH